MRLVVIGTTINGEGGYVPFDRLAAESEFSDVTFVIAGDTNSKPFDVSKFSCRVEYLQPKDQERFSVSDTIGWKTPRRRPVAWLRAVELAPDYILSIDDDNIPPPDYFRRWHEVLTRSVSRIAVPVGTAEAAPWHNYLKSSDAPIEIYPRGFPLPFRRPGATAIAAAPDPITADRIGLFQGISLGDPDIDGMTRLVYPKRLPLDAIGEKNYCLREVWSPYNMQNTVFSKILFPLPILWPHAAQFDDIYASFVWQKILFNSGLYVHIGDPVNRQDRGIRDVLNVDFRETVEGYFFAHHVWEVINGITEKDPIAFMGKLMEYGDGSSGSGELSFSRHRWSSPDGERHIIARHHEFFRAHLRDIAKILG
ncbi:MAG: hypothetical protein Q8R35_03700 [bacterium]|nr:hypothetical protein [bacterium]